MTDVMEHIRILAQEIGPRASTSCEERYAAEYAAGVLRKLGLEVAVEPFRAPASWTWQNFISFGLILVAVPVYLLSPLAAFLLAVAGLAANILENDTMHIVTALMPQQQSQNVVARLEPPGEVRRRVVLAAHLDSSRSDFAHHPSRVAGFRTTYLLNTLMGGLVVVCCGLGLLVPRLGYAIPWRLEWWLTLPPALVLSVVQVLLIHRALTGKVVAGANDNGSGVAAVLAAMERLAAEPPQGTEVWAVLTGCEEVVTNGMVAFLRRHGQELRDAFFLIPDNCGAGRPLVATLEGMLIRHRPPRELRTLATEVAAARPELNLLLGPYRAGYTDGTAALARGYRALSVLAVDERGVLPNWHWPTDVLENVEPGTVRAVEAFLLEMVRRLDPSGS